MSLPRRFAVEWLVYMSCSALSPVVLWAIEGDPIRFTLDTFMVALPMGAAIYVVVGMVRLTLASVVRLATK